MEKRIYDEQTGISYTLQGDYYLPDLTLPKQEDKPIGLWGQRHLRYIKQHRKILYTNLLTSGKLNDYLFEIDKYAESLFESLFPLYKQKYGVTEQLKATNQQEWINRSNSVMGMIREILNQEINK